MRASPRRLTFWLCLVLLPLAFGGAAAAQEARGERRARELWEQAVAAKGGRERLYGVSSLSMSFEETVRNFLGVVVHRGHVERLYVFPDKSWAWDDGLPPPFGLSVRLLDIERNVRCTLYAGAAAPTCGPAGQSASPPDEGLTQAQYLYLLETRWVKPAPVSVSEDRLGLKKVDVLHTRFQNRRVDYFLDRKSHLPLRVEVFYGASERATLTAEFSEYAAVAGVLMPGRQKKTRLNFQLNPPYDEGVFKRPPSIEAGPKAWQRPAKISRRKEERPSTALGNNSTPEPFCGIIPARTQVVILSGREVV